MPSDFATPARPEAFSSQAEPDQDHAPDAADNPDQNAPDQDGQSNADPAQEDPRPGETDAPEDGGAPAEPPVEPSPVEPSPVEPSPVEPPPVEPSPVEPPPVEPPPVEPPPVEPPPVEPSPVEPPPGESPSYVDEHTARGPNSIALVMPVLKLQASASNELIVGESTSVVIGSKIDMVAGAKFLYTAAPVEFKVNYGISIISDRSRLLKRVRNENQTINAVTCIGRKNKVYKSLCQRIKVAGEDMKRIKNSLQTCATKAEVEAMNNEITATVERLNEQCTTAVAELNTVAAQSTNLAEKNDTTVGVANTLAGSIQSASVESTRTAASCTQSHVSSSTLAAQSSADAVATLLN
ncbi:hypothetical protein [Desulfovibrio sp. ZJ369]|uniref:hypothetical protein n=1 Tax=Desulfovibrio sp. ZJ369 TaxID=2709793 RepID=UPI0013ED0CBD|nr:hypothetical protein [Desulfovibrio sp. ZJ369]